MNSVFESFSDISLLGTVFSCLGAIISLSSLVITYNQPTKHDDGTHKWSRKVILIVLHIILTFFTLILISIPLTNIHNQTKIRQQLIPLPKPIIGINYPEPYTILVRNVDKTIIKINHKITEISTAMPSATLYKLGRAKDLLENSNKTFCVINAQFFSTDTYLPIGTLYSNGRILLTNRDPIDRHDVPHNMTTIGILENGIVIDEVSFELELTIGDSVFEDIYINKSPNHRSGIYIFSEEYSHPDGIFPNDDIIYYRSGKAAIVKNGRIIYTDTAKSIPKPKQAYTIVIRGEQFKKYQSLLQEGTPASLKVIAKHINKESTDIWSSTKTALGGLVSLLRNGKRKTNIYSRTITTSEADRSVFIVFKDGDYGIAHYKSISIEDLISELEYMIPNVKDAVLLDGGSSSGLYCTDVYAESHSVRGIANALIFKTKY